MKREYVGSAYIGIVGPENSISECDDSIKQIKIRPGDMMRTCRSTKGYEGRQYHLNEMYLNSDHSFLMLLDHDQVFPQDCLEKLRSNKLPFVSGLYMRRRFAPMIPIWFYPPKPGQITVRPWVTIPEKGKLHELGASGWGCMLIHRDVITAVRKVLKGEWDIIEDDMDIWPYDLKAMMKAIRTIYKISRMPLWEVSDRNNLRTAAKTLKDEFRPLRAQNDVVGSDVRYPFYARAAGFKLFGDPDVRCGHMVNYPVSPDDYEGSMPPEKIAELITESLKEWEGEEKRLQKARRAL